MTREEVLREVQKLAAEHGMLAMLITSDLENGLLVNSNFPDEAHAAILDALIELCVSLPRGNA